MEDQKQIHRGCGGDVEMICTEKDIDGDGVRRVDFLMPDYECDLCGWIPGSEVQTVDGEPKYPKVRVVRS